ncbi:RNA polymerase sigma factor SigB [Brevibacillus ginsengisoli]|uniref:RNA polymerase sigma factor SigB n=1 Tax=Brevibacillus ginsengisoli TaxID=363854 RepID=UPI003CEBC5BD
MTTNPRRHGLSKEDAYALIEQLKENPTPEIQTELVLYYRDLVESLASRFARRHEMVEDLRQVGMIGLLAAFRRYDASFGRSFESFAVPTIVGEIKRYMRDKTWSVHVPRRIKELGPRIKKAIDELTIQLQRSPQIADIAAFVKVSEEEVLETLEMGRNYHSLSMDSEIEAEMDGNTVTLLDLIGQADNGYEKIDQEMLISNLFHVLTEREKKVISLTFYENLSQKQAGEVLGISQMHISRLQRRALHKLREAIRLDETINVKK